MQGAAPAYAKHPDLSSLVGLRSDVVDSQIARSACGASADDCNRRRNYQPVAILGNRQSCGRDQEDCQGKHSQKHSDSAAVRRRIWAEKRRISTSER